MGKPAKPDRPRLPSLSHSFTLNIVVMAKSLPAIEQACPVVTAVLQERGLALHPEKTRIVQRTEGVDFLGFHWRALWRWVKRRHPKKPKRWLYRRYGEVGKYGATFYTDSRDRRGQTIRLRLERMPTLPIVRHVKVKGRASSDDPTLNAYWETRRLTRGRQRVARGGLLYGIAAAQRWRCPGCGQALFDGQAVHLHHLIPVHAGGSDDRANRQWLHATCHRQRHRQGVTAGHSA